MTESRQITGIRAEQALLMESCQVVDDKIFFALNPQDIQILSCSMTPKSVKFQIQ
jgi:hypothetical protein